jgi:predicted amidohydrolase YtcJ
VNDRLGRTLLRGGSVYSPADPFATAMVVDGAEIVWIGSDIGGDVHRDTVDTVVELEGALVTPAFVDAHVHTTSTGLALQTADLSLATSREHLLQLLAEASRLADGVVLAHGWDDTAWRDPALPSLAQIDAAVGGRPAYITRTDVHSALVSTSLLELCPEVRTMDGFSQTDGVMVLQRDAHHLARGVAQASITPTQRESAQRLALSAAAALGIAAVHEMSGPDISSIEDLTALLQLNDTFTTPQVAAYWGAFEGAGLTDHVRVHGAAGDLFVDGSLGSHTALLREPYADLNSIGTSYLDVAQIRDHIVWCTNNALQAGFHVIGDGAMDLVVAALREAADVVGATSLRAMRHRLEHAEMIDETHLTALLEYGVVLSVQPAFDERWGGTNGMYAQRLGIDRAKAMNPFAMASRMGIALAFGSDSPVTAFNPWAGVRAAAFMHEPMHSLSVRAAFQAHTRGGWRSVGHDSAGIIAPGYAAHYAIWRAHDLVVQAADERVSAWSTDPRSGTPGLPDLTPGRALPTCIRTVVTGHTIFDAAVLEVSSS